MSCKPLTKKEWESSVADAFSLAVKSTYQDMIDAAVKAEREACAKLCDDKVNSEYATGKVDHNEMAWTQSCAIAIRARGQA